MNKSKKKKITKKERILQEVIKIITTYKRRLKLRQIYYRLVAKQIIANTTSQYKQLSKILVEAREKGVINPELIIDGFRVEVIELERIEDLEESLDQAIVDVDDSLEADGCG
ncbi:MAG: hypothetical protein HZR80_21150 [Candidatus Heimdallarchaeota archaeon]